MFEKDTLNKVAYAGATKAFVRFAIKRWYLRFYYNDLLPNEFFFY